MIYLKLPDSSLQQSIHDRTKDFNIRDIFNTSAISNNDNDIRVRISIYLISEAIKKVHKSVINTIFNNPFLSLEIEAASIISTIPEIDRIAIYKIKFWQFGTINKNEKTITDIYDIYNNIFLN